MKVELRWLQTDTPLCNGSMAVTIDGRVRCSTLQYREVPVIVGEGTEGWKNVELVDDSNADKTTPAEETPK